MSLFDSASVVITPNGYKEDKLYSIKPTDGSGDLVVTRATTATRVNSEGLIEQVPYNLLQRSEEFNNASWAKSNATVTANSVIAPNNTLTADSFTESTDGVASNHQIDLSSTTFPVVTGSSYTLSFFVKSNSTRSFRCAFSSGAFGSNGAFFDVQNKAVLSQTGGTATITELTDNWVRVTFTATATATTTTNIFLGSANGTTRDYIGTGTLAFYLWGAQLVTGSTAKEYFPTTDRLDVPRLDYTNSSCPSILIEPQRTNLVLRSEEFDNAYWVKAQGGIALAPVVTANVETAPNGTTSADRIVFSLNGGTSSSDISQLESALFTSVSITRTQSFYIKTTDGTTKAFSFVSPTGVATTITVTSSYQRFTYTTTGINAGTIRLRLRGSASGEGTATTASIAIWGAQFEDGSNATSYIPTVASTVTRNADVISKTGISSLIGQTEGTIYAEIKVNKLLGTASRYIFHISDGTANNRIYIAFSGASSNVIRARIFNGGTLQCSINSSTITATGTYKLAMAYKNNDIVFYINGVQIGTDTSATIPTCSRVDLGHNYTGASQLNDAITNANIWKTRLTNTELATLTTI